MNIALCKKLEENFAPIYEDEKKKKKIEKEGKTKRDKCDCEECIEIKLHIIDYTNSIREVYENEEELEVLLNKYNFITKPRANEYPCDFEPFGWKDNGGLISTYANAPGNTLPIIWGDNCWSPLFNRYFNPWHKGEEDEKRLDCKRTGKCKFKKPYPKERIKELKKTHSLCWEKIYDQEPKQR